MRALFAAHAKVNVAARDGSTALILAAYAGHTQALQTLLAAFRGWTECVRALLASGANVNAPRGGMTPLMWAALDKDLELVKVLLAAGAAVNAIDNKVGSTPLTKSTLSVRGHLATVEAVLAAGANVDAADKDGEIALFDAVDVGSTAAVKALLARGADVNMRTTTGQTAIDRARAPQKKEIRTLLE